MNGSHLLSRAGPPGRGIFRALSEDEWNTVGFPPPITVERKSPLFHEHDPATHVYILVSGLVKLHCHSGRNTQIVGISEPGDVIGLEALSGNTYETGATALQRVTARRVTGSRFESLLRDNPSVATALVRNLGSECARLRTLLTDIGTKSALARVASLLLSFMERQTPDHPTAPFILPITRQDIGALLGLSPETVSRQLKSLVGNRLIRLDHKRLTIVDLGSLRSLARTS